MRKNMFIILVVILFITFAAISFAEVGIQFRVPYQGVVNSSNMKSVAAGSSVLLTFDIDDSVTLGVLSEQINYTEKPAGGGADVSDKYNVNAIRINKAVGELGYIGLDLGTATFGGVASVQQASLADIVGGTEILSSEGKKVKSFLSVEIAYRMLQPSVAPTIAGGVTNFGGVFLSLGAGVNF